MFHSNRIIYALLLASAVLGGCSQREGIEETFVNENATTETANVIFQLQTNAPTTTLTRSAEDSYTYDEGTRDEYQVNNARVYLFDAPTKLFVKSFLLTDLTLTGNRNHYFIYESERVSVPQGTYDIFVTANTGRFINKTNESEFLADIDSMTYARGRIDNISNGVVMTNRASDNNSVVIANNQTNEDNVVVVTLERVLARIDVGKSTEQFVLTDKNNRQYASVTLDGYYIVNLPKYYYSYRHTAVLTSMDMPTWSINENFGNIKDVNGYVIDPYFFNKAIDASSFTNGEKYYVNYFGDYSNPNSISWTAFKPAQQVNTIYSLENCTLAPAQKNGYSTGIIFRGKVEPYNNVYRLGSNGSLELVTDTNQYPEVLYYYNYRFYTTAEALASAIGVSTIAPNSLDLYQARKFEKDDSGYHCYYNYWIRHEDNKNPTVMGVMEFAIVRNNLYKILVANVSGLGYHEPPINPDTPDEGETYLKVVINVKPWIVRDLTDIVL